jgi:hypothetical protein
MEEERVYTTSLAVQAFVTLILTIAKGKAVDADFRTAHGDDPSQSPASHQARNVLTAPRSHRKPQQSRLLILGPFLTLILTLRYPQSAGDGTCWTTHLLQGWGSRGIGVLSTRSAFPGF